MDQPPSGTDNSLVRHKLQAPIEEGLAASNVMTAAALPHAIEDLLDAEPVFAAMMADGDERRQLLHMFATLPLTPPLDLKLTVARDERPEVLSHSLKVAYCAAALAHRCGRPHHEVTNAAAAGLFHDLGLLYIAPELLKGRRALGEHERNYIYAHPVTSYLILERSPIWHPIVSTAVLEHHERIDGSGYPQGLEGNKLGALGQLLAVAELGATLLSHTGGHASRDRIEVVLRMNEGKLNHEYATHLLEMLPPRSGGTFPAPANKVLEVLINLSIGFQRWQAVAKQMPDAALTAFVAKRMTRLDRSLAAIGIDLDYWTTFNSDDEFDLASLSEIEAAAHEGIWQLHAIADEVRRRREHPGATAEPIAAAMEEWLASVDALQRA